MMYLWILSAARPYCCFDRSFLFPTGLMVAVAVAAVLFAL